MSSWLPAFCIISVLLIHSAALHADEPAAFAGKTSEWHGFASHAIEVDGHAVQVVVPKEPAPGRPWVWHGEFFGHKPAPDIALLNRGFHCVYVRVPNQLGAPSAVAAWNAVYQQLTQRHGLAKKPALVGLSRGGLYCYNWAAANPESVACIYGDAPVCDFKSWPGGKGIGPGSPRDWQLVLERYGFASEAEALAYGKNPVDNLAPLAKAGVPLLHVYGDADEVVPWQENTGLVAERYRALGGSVTLICKPGVKHHPHGLTDPTPIVDFIVRHASVPPQSAPAPRMKDAVDRRAAGLKPSRLVVYKTVQDRELYLHVFEPQGWKPEDRRGCYVVIHGGGWVNGSPERMYPFADHFAKLGMVGISVQYRLIGREPESTVFDCVKDGRSALRFIKSHSNSLGIDPEKIVVSGGSAGGHVAAGTALFDGVDEASDDPNISPVPQALVLLFPVIDTSRSGYGQAKIGERWQELSPAHQVDGSEPPTIIFHGSADTTTPLAGAELFRKEMLAAGNRCELVVHQGGGHGYLMRDDALYESTMKQTEAFLDSLNLLPSQD